MGMPSQGTLTFLGTFLWYSNILGEAQWKKHPVYNMNVL